jgi:hypothetical protein
MLSRKTTTLPGRFAADQEVTSKAVHIVSRRYCAALFRMIEALGTSVRSCGRETATMDAW